MEVVKKYVFQLLMVVGVNATSVYNYKMTSHVIAVCSVFVLQLMYFYHFNIISLLGFHNKNVRV